MSGLVVTVEPWHERYILVWGRETFYNSQREMITFASPEEAKAWLTASHPELQFRTNNLQSTFIGVE